MAIGLTASGIILGFIYQEYNYDSENENPNKVYRVIENYNGNKQVYTYSLLAQSLKNDFPEVEESARVGFFYGHLACSSDENKFNENWAIFADPCFFNLFSFPLVKGNSKNCLISPNSIAISEKTANKFFGKIDPIGKHIRIGENTKFTVTAVFQDFKPNSNFKGNLIFPLAKISELTPIQLEPNWQYESDINTFVSLKKNANVSDISKKAKTYLSKFIADNNIGLEFQHISNIHVNKELSWESTPQIDVRYLNVLFIVTLLILCISIANFLFLYIGTAMQRTIGIGIKKVYGASKKVLFIEYFKEVVFLMILSVIFATVIAIIYHKQVASYASLPKVALIDYKLGSIFLSIIILTTLFSGIYPSVVLSSKKAIKLFNTKSFNTQNRFNTLSLLVIIQFVLCISLISFTLLMHKQTQYMLSRDTGFAKNELVTIPLNMKLEENIHHHKIELFTQELKKHPGIKSTCLSFSSPSAVGCNTDGVSWEEQQNSEKTKTMWNWESVSYDYFKTIGVDIIQGREFCDNFPNDIVNWDNKKCAFIINESALKHMEITDPIGKEFMVWGLKGPIVGIVKDYNFKSMHSDVSPLFYVMHSTFWNEIIVRIDPKITTVTADIKTVWNKFLPRYPLEINHVNDQIELLYEREQNLGRILSIFSFLAILIVSIGLFTLTVLTLNQRKKEIAIRKVNGAKSYEVITMLNKEFIKLVIISFIIATPFSLYAMYKWLENFAYKTNLSWLNLALAGLISLVIALLTTSWKSWSTAQRNPVKALKYQ